MTDEELEKKALAVKETNAVMTVSDEEFMAVVPQQDMTANDVMIPKILVMQPMSPRVVAQDSAFGDLVETLGYRTLANAKTAKSDSSPLLIIPIHWAKYWINKKHNAQTNRWDFEGIVKMDHANQNLDMWEEWQGKDGAMRKREYMHLFHVLIPGEPIPYAIAFKGSSKKSGDALVTQMFTINKKIKADKAYLNSPMGKAIKITPVITTKNNNTFCTMEISVDRNSTFEEACECLQWSKQISSGTTQTDHSDLAEEGYVNTQGGGFNA